MATSQSPSTNDIKYLLNVREPIEECVQCLWCRQVLSTNDANEKPETHYESCKYSEFNGLSSVFKELRTINQKFEALNVDMKKTEEKIMSELKDIKTEIANLKPEVRTGIENNKETADLKSEFKKELDIKCVETRVVLSTVFKKVNALEEGLKEKIAEVSGRVSGVTETVSTVIHSLLNLKEKEATLSADITILNELDRSKQETEALWVQLRQSEGNIETTRTQLEQEVAHLKTRTNTLSEQLENTDRTLQVLKTQLENGQGKNELGNKSTTLQVEPSAFDQLAIPMDCFNLVTRNSLFQPSYKWTIDGIESILAKESFELTSELFQWNGYPVRARAKLTLMDDDTFDVSLRFADENETEDLAQIPEGFYLLRDKHGKIPQHKCVSVGYLSGSTFASSLTFDENLVPKSWLNQSAYKVNDAVEIEIYVEPPSMAQQAHSYDGTLEWNMEHYGRRLQLEKEDLVPYQESPYFYTGPKGYRVRVEMFLNGYDEGEPLTAQISFLAGQFDADLPVSFLHSTTVILVNRKEPGKSLSKTVVKDIENGEQYTLEMCELDEVENFVENDTLLCKVVIIEKTSFIPNCFGCYMNLIDYS